MVYVLGIAVAWLYFVVWFFALGHYLHLEQRNELRKIPTFIRYSLVAGLLPGVVVDFVFNHTYGTLHFKKFPNDHWLFSGLVEEFAKKYDKGDRGKGAIRGNRWRKILNTIDPGHIHE